MNRKSFAALLAAAAFLFLAPSCQTARRAGKDLLITAGSPFVILYGAASDAAEDSSNFQEGFEGGTAANVLVFPFAFGYRVIDHGFSVALHALDLVTMPLYAGVELVNPDVEIEPLQIYRGTWFDKEPSARDDAAEASGN